MSFKDFYNGDTASSSSFEFLRTLLGGGKTVTVGQVFDGDKGVVFHQNIWQKKIDSETRWLDYSLTESLKGVAEEKEFVVSNDKGILAIVPYELVGEVRYSTRTGKVSVYKKNSAAILLSGIKW